MKKSFILPLILSIILIPSCTLILPVRSPVATNIPQLVHSPSIQETQNKVFSVTNIMGPQVTDGPIGGKYPCYISVEVSFFSLPVLGKPVTIAFTYTKGPDWPDMADYFEINHVRLSIERGYEIISEDSSWKGRLYKGGNPIEDKIIVKPNSIGEFDIFTSYYARPYQGMMYLDSYPYRISVGSGMVCTGVFTDRGFLSSKQLQFDGDKYHSGCGGCVDFLLTKR